MTREKVEDFLLSFSAAGVREDDKNKVRIFEVDFNKLVEIWRAKNGEYSGEFEKKTAERIFAKQGFIEDEKIIFAILHEGLSPVRVEVKTGRQLAKNLSEKNESVVPSKLMNENEWNQIIGDGQVPIDDIFDLIKLSYRLATEN